MTSDGFATCTFQTLPDRQPIEGVFELREGTGTYAEIHVRRGTSFPSQLEGANVQPLEQWPVSLWIYPVGKKLLDGYCAAARRYPSPSGATPRPFLTTGAHYWGYQETGYKGKLPRPKDHPTDPDVIVCWTYVSTMPGVTGDLQYEICVYPTAVPSDSGEHQYGTRVIIQRGVLRVIPSEGDPPTEGG